jgi:hypothetical protein
MLWTAVCRSNMTRSSSPWLSQMTLWSCKLAVSLDDRIPEVVVGDEDSDEADMFSSRLVEK